MKGNRYCSLTAVSPITSKSSPSPWSSNSELNCTSPMGASWLHSLVIAVLHAGTLHILDESSRIDDGMLAAVTPMLSETDGDLLLLSTPAGRRGFFYSAWSDESQDWLRINAKRADYPHRIRAGFLEQERKTLGPALYSQEHENSFIEDGDQVLADVAIEAIKRWNRPGISVLTALEGL